MILTNEQEAFQKLAQEFARDEMAPHAKHWDEQHEFPVDTLRKAAELGFASLYVSEESQGAYLSRWDATLIFEELAMACVSTAAYISIHNMVSWIIDHYADDVLKQKYLPKLNTMDFFGSYCLTEPNSGSDAASLKTSAVRDGDHYIVNGTKAFISGGSTSDVYVCMVRTGEPGPKGISCLLVEKETPGLSFGKREEKLGWHSQPTTMVFFENCRVPVSHLIGEEGSGFKIALSALNGGRVNIAACSLGGARACLQHAHRYMHEREQFQHKLSDFQALQFRFADLYTQLEAARLMVWRAARALDTQATDAPLHCAMAKRFATDVGFEISHQSLQLFGGYGYLKEYPIERYFRDLRVHPILEGSNEIMRTIIARHVLSEDFEI